MKPEDQRVAIAEVCGIVDIPRRVSFGYIGIPDYPYDLNAMREALRVLNDEQQITLIRHLIGADKSFDVLNKMEPDRFNDREAHVANHLCSIGWDEAFSFILQAKPETLAEAFLRTLNPWKE